MTQRPFLCPSAPSQIEVAQIFGVIGGTAAAPDVVYLEQPVTLTEDLARLPHGLVPDEVYRLTSACQSHACQHFTGDHCGLGARLKQELEATVAALPTCSIRAECRWFQEQGRDICFKCPSVVTRTFRVTSDAKTNQATTRLRVL